MRKEKFLKIKHSVIKLNNFNKEDIIINNNELINKKESSIIKKINEFDFDDLSIYKIEILQSNLKDYVDIFIIINLENIKKFIKEGKIIPNRESLFKLLNVYQYSSNSLINKKIRLLNPEEIKNLDNELHIYPHHIISIGNHYYDLKSHKIYNKFNYQKVFIKGGIINLDSDLNILETLILFKNNNKNLFILDSNQLDIFYRVAIELNYPNCYLVNNIKNLNENLIEYSNIFVSYFHLKKYFTEILKEYISKSREINFLDSIENMISDYEISEINNNNKFFQIKWDQTFINLECFSSNKLVDIIKSIKGKSNWFLNENKALIDQHIKSIIKIITPSYKFTDNYSMIKENVIYYKSLSELQFLKINFDKEDMISIKNFVYRHRIFHLDKNLFLEKISINYDKNTIDYKISDSTREMFDLCSKYNKLNTFYYLLNPIYTMENKVTIEINTIEDTIKNLNNKEKLEEFKLKLAIHEKMDAELIYKLKKNLAEMYDNIEELENKLFQIKNNSTEDEDSTNSNESDEDYLSDKKQEDKKICPISHEVILPENSAITICNHEFNFIGLLESLFNDPRCPICRYDIDYKQIKAKFDFNLDDLMKIIQQQIENSKSKKIIIISKYDNLIIYLKKKLTIKSTILYSTRSMEKLEKYKVLFLNRKNLSYHMGYINSDHFIFCESIWDDELNQYFGIVSYLNKNLDQKIKIDILIPDI